MEVKEIIEQRNTHLKSELTRMLALYAGQWLLRSKTGKVGPLRILSGGVLLYAGATGKLPFSDWFAKINQNHSQLNCKIQTRIQQPRSLVFAYFRDAANIKRHISWVKNITALQGVNGGWRVEASFFGFECAWNIYIVKERQDEFLGWSTDTDVLFYNTGKIEVHPGSSTDDTVLEFVFSYTPPGGKLGNKLAQPIHGLVECYVKRYIKRVKKDLNAM